MPLFENYFANFKGLVVFAKSNPLIIYRVCHSEKPNEGILRFSQSQSRKIFPF
jgi:hypothetical protein